MILSNEKHVLLAEALRRYTRFHSKESMLTAWTGLGCASEYKKVLDSGLMAWVSAPPHRRCKGWLRLTEAGAKIVKRWINSGWGFEQVEGGYLPPKEVE